MQKSNYVPKDWLRHALALILAFSLSFGILPANNAFAGVKTATANAKVRPAEIGG